MDKTLICTVGTSLFSGNLEKIVDRANPLYVAYSQKNWDALANAMLRIDPHERMLGAEINTIEMILRNMERKGDRLNRLIFLVSDTQDGENTGIVLEKYFECRKREDDRLRALNVQHWTVKDLQPDDPDRFKKSGLLNLVRCIARGIQEAGGASRVFIDATGGYKAQIAIAVMFGQATGVDVLYKHESFGSIIDFPPMPVALDFRFFDLYNDLFARFYRNPQDTLSLAEMAAYFDNDVQNYEQLLQNHDFSSMIVFFEIETTEANGGIEYLFGINHVGLIYVEAALQHNLQFRLNFVPRAATKRRPPSFTDDHFPRGFKEFVDKIWKNETWINTIVSLPYYHQRGITRRGFYIVHNNDGFSIIGNYRDRDGFGAPFRIQCESENDGAYMYSALNYLNGKAEEY